MRTILLRDIVDDVPSRCFDVGGVPFESLARSYGTPLFVYDASAIREDYNRLSQALAIYPSCRIFYSLKANSSLAIAALMRTLGASVDVASIGEAMLALRAGFDDGCISLTSCCLSDADLDWIARRHLDIVLDNLEQGLRFARCSPYRSTVGLRVNPGLLLPHFDPCLGSGPESKFGVPLDTLGQVIETLSRNGLDVEGLHFHIGSGSLAPDHHIDALRALLRAIPSGCRLKWINIGGGLGVPYAPWLEAMDLTKLAAGIALLMRQFPGNETGGLELRLEPGEFLLVRAGWLLSRVWAVKDVPDGRPGEPPIRKFAVIDGGANLLPGASQFGTWYPINVCTPDPNLDSVYDVVGPLNQTGDRLARARSFPRINSGDLLAVSMAGAYAASRATRFNGRPLPAEVLITDGVPYLVREAETYDALWRGQTIPGILGEPST